MLNFTVGPVQSDKEILELGSQQLPYFRTPEFSEMMKENEAMILELMKACETSRAVFLTGSGTSAMEAAIMNTLTPKDRVLVINGGSFGERFVQLCRLHSVQFDEVKLDFGRSLTCENLFEYEDRGYTAFVVNMHETSTGVLYDMNLIADFCKRNGCFLIVDAISAFIADPIDMAGLGIDVLITGSQKALALPPGISIIALSKKAIERIENNPEKCMYLSLKSALDNAKRGQTPFTPAVGILIQLNKRLKSIISNGGICSETRKICDVASYFRNEVKKLGVFEFFSQHSSNAVTTLTHKKGVSAFEIFKILKDEYEIFVCPNGGELADKIFRVGHIGAITKADVDVLINALNNMKERGLI